MRYWVWGHRGQGDEQRATSKLLDDLLHRAAACGLDQIDLIRRSRSTVQHVHTQFSVHVPSQHAWASCKAGDSRTSQQSSATQTPYSQHAGFTAAGRAERSAAYWRPPDRHPRHRWLERGRIVHCMCSKAELANQILCDSLVR
jgi:hypothetical protein